MCKEVNELKSFPFPYHKMYVCIYSCFCLLSRSEISLYTRVRELKRGPFVLPRFACTSLSGSITRKLVINPGIRGDPGGQQTVVNGSREESVLVFMCVFLCKPRMYVFITDGQENTDPDLLKLINA